MFRNSTTKALCLFVLVLMPLSVPAHEGLPEQIAAMTAKIKRDPKNPSLYLQRGELYRLHGKWIRADADYRHALRLDPTLNIVNLARGTMLLESGQYVKAKAALDGYLRQRPDHAEAFITRARVYAKMKMRVEAAADFTHALTLVPTQEPELYLERARVLAGDARHLEEALQGLDEGIKKLGTLVTLELAAIDIELRRKNHDAALTRLELITAQSDRKEMWLVRRGEILKAAGRHEEARDAFNAALGAIDSLPPHRRQNRAIAALQLRARAGLN